MRPLFLAALLTAIGLLCAPSIALAQGTPVLLRDSFPIGSDDGIMCQVQDRSIANRAKTSMFDRSWAVICRDSAKPVGFVYSFRDAESGVAERISAQRPEEISCSDSAEFAADMSGFSRRVCKVSGTELDYSLYRGERGGDLYLAEGFTAYDSATLLALKSIIDNRIADGSIDVATTSVSDPLAFARVQAASLAPEQALAEGYRRNLSGEYAEAAEYFETLQQRTDTATEDANINPGEYLVNRALQKSNLGDFGEADRLFAEAGPLVENDPIAQRLQRNFEGIHLLNQGRIDEAVERIRQPIRSSLRESENLSSGLEITTPISSRINGSDRTAGLLGFVDELKLSPEERAEIIDAQALQLTGTAERLRGNDGPATSALLQGYNRAIAVRDGRVTSITRLRAQTLAELALIAEGRGDLSEAERLLRDGLDLLNLQYPETRAVNGAKARLAAFLTRRGQTEEAMLLYRSVVESSIGKRGAISGLANQLRPYFRLLSEQIDSDPKAAADFFEATQILVRPGVAETQAILARELSAGSDEASRLFRQSNDLTRNIERLRIQFTALNRVDRTATVQQRLNELSQQIDRLETAQQRTQVKLADYPQYRAVATSAISLTEFRESLDNDEAYVRLAIVSGQPYIFFTDKSNAKAVRVESTEDEIERMVDAIRASVSVFENGRYVTYPYDIETARTLYNSLFGSVSDRLASARHIIFEPDGALLRLPINLLVVDDESVETYLAQADSPDGDPFDMRGVAWLGRGREVSTAVSAQAFADARKAPASNASLQYLGMGENVPLGETMPSSVRGSTSLTGDCSWSPNEWNRPIDDAELVFASSELGRNTSKLLTGPEFTDRQIMDLENLSEYRILHFATHGLVTPPAPRCPARPALLTSFGSEDSDGLLSFDEIFELDLDADIVILSACDTAGKAGVGVTREAGISTGGGTALDGLVRSFIGAGGRSVLASHWPAPDDYQATERLIGGLFGAQDEQSIGNVLLKSQTELMDDPLTSHPYYWAGFAIVGDAARPFLRATDVASNPSSPEVDALK